jgi:hypothetical protein
VSAKEQYGKPLERGITTALVTVASIAAVVAMGVGGFDVYARGGGGGGGRDIVDCNGNGIPDHCDLLIGSAVDCNGNGVPDECDIADGTSDDCNGNGVPDECEESTPHGLVGTYVGTFSGVPGWWENCEPTDNVEPVDPFPVVLGRIDPTVNFDWGGWGGVGWPWPGFEPDDFRVTWSGYVETPFDKTGDYTFCTRTDDGVRLYVDGVLLIDEWVDQSATEHCGTIYLEGGQIYRLVMEYYEAGGDAVAELRWQPPDGQKHIIPNNRLLPYQDCNLNGVPDDCDIGSEDIYALDDEESDIYVRADGTYMAWMNQFTVIGNLSTITDIDVTFYSSAVGQQVTLYLWDDPDGDGDPTDATVLMSHSMIVQPGMDNPNELSRVDVPDTFVGAAGTSFFVGVIDDVALGSSDFPAAGDWDPPATPGRSWLVGANAPINPNDLTAGAVEFGLIEDLIPYVVNWNVRAIPALTGDANGNGIPDECDCPGDLDHDFDVDLADLTRLLSNYGMMSGAMYWDGDIDFDGDVDLADLNALLAVYGTTCN